LLRFFCNNSVVDSAENTNFSIVPFFFFSFNYYFCFLGGLILFQLLIYKGLISFLIKKVLISF
jgi:hypothetical protein